MPKEFKNNKVNLLFLDIVVCALGLHTPIFFE